VTRIEIADAGDFVNSAFNRSTCERVCQPRLIRLLDSDVVAWEFLEALGDLARGSWNESIISGPRVSILRSLAMCVSSVSFSRASCAKEMMRDDQSQWSQSRNHRLHSCYLRYKYTRTESRAIQCRHRNRRTSLLLAHKSHHARRKCDVRPIDDYGRWFPFLPFGRGGGSLLGKPRAAF